MPPGAAPSWRHNIANASVTFTPEISTRNNAVSLSTACAPPSTTIRPPTSTRQAGASRVHFVSEIGGTENGRPALAGCLQERPHPFLHPEVQPGGGFIQNQEIEGGRQGAGQSHPPLLTAGKFTALPPPQSVQSHGVGHAIVPDSSRIGVAHKTQDFSYPQELGKPNLLRHIPRPSPRLPMARVAPENGHPPSEGRRSPPRYPVVSICRRRWGRRMRPEYSGRQDSSFAQDSGKCRSQRLARKRTSLWVSIFTARERAGCHKKVTALTHCCHIGLLTWAALQEKNISTLLSSTVYTGTYAE